MRIAIVGPVYPYKGGISQFTSMLADLIAGEDEVLVVSWKRQYPAWLYPGGDQKTPDGSRTVRAPVRFLLDYRNPLSWIRAGLLLRRWRPDAVLLNWATTFVAPIYLVLIALLRALPGSRRRHLPKPVLVAICHNVLPHERRPLDGLATRSVLGRVDVCVLHARSQRAELTGLRVRARIVQLFLPEWGPLLASAAVDAGLRSELGLGDRVCLFFGHVRPYKGLEYLLDAMPQVLKSVDVDLLVVGEFWGSKSRYLSQIERLGIGRHVRVVDRYVPEAEVASYFAASDVLVLPYVEATQSAVIPLAWALGTPVISTRVGGIPDVVVDGETALLVSPRDSDELARTLVRFFEEDLGPALRQRTAQQAERWSWRRYITEVRAEVARLTAS